MDNYWVGCICGAGVAAFLWVLCRIPERQKLKQRLESELADLKATSQALSVKQLHENRQLHQQLERTKRDLANSREDAKRLGMCYSELCEMRQQIRNAVNGPRPAAPALRDDPS